MACGAEQWAAVHILGAMRKSYRHECRSKHKHEEEVGGPSAECVLLQQSTVPHPAEEVSGLGARDTGSAGTAWFIAGQLTGRTCGRRSPARRVRRIENWSPASTPASTARVCKGAIVGGCVAALLESSPVPVLSHPHLILVHDRSPVKVQREGRHDVEGTQQRRGDGQCEVPTGHDWNLPVPGARNPGEALSEAVLYWTHQSSNDSAMALRGASAPSTTRCERGSR